MKTALIILSILFIITTITGLIRNDNSWYIFDVVLIIIAICILIYNIYFK